MAVLVSYLLVIARRRGQLSRPVFVQGVAATAAVFIALGGYCTANLVVNDYFGLSSISNIALLGKVKIYNMVDEAPPPYSALIPQVNSNHDVWGLVLAPPFNDRNSALAGEFARAAIFHDPLRFAQNVMGTAITYSGEHDSQFLFIRSSGPFGQQLHVLLVFDQLRYRAFVIFPVLALAWLVAGLLVPPANRRTQMLGVLGLVTLYSWLTTSAGTYGEFERLRMTINPISTILVVGTMLLLLPLAVRNRHRLIPAIGLIALDVAAIGFLPRITSTEWSEVALLAIAAIQTVAIVRWSRELVGTGTEGAREELR